MKKRKLFFLLFVLFVLYSGKSVHATEETKIVIPVVQIISYGDIFGNYLQMRGRGSASIISKKGILLTNNHVVDDGDGGTNTAFQICVTENKSEAPDCRYTASLLARDKQKDIALLRIDTKDIFGQPISFEDFPVLPLDFSYIPKAQEETVAIGYPRIGLETISETKGVIAGTVTNNGQIYIKMDTMIAGGNSGGPLLKDGKVIGINTYGVGGGQSDWMGYALLIKEAKDFIIEHENKEAIASNTRLNIQNHFQVIRSINKLQKIDDLVFSLSFGGDYRITDYIPTKMIKGSVAKKQDYSISDFSIQTIETPALTTPNAFFYFLESLSFYNKDREKLVQKKINGLTFYEPVALQDATQGVTSPYKRYIAQIHPTVMLLLTLQVPGSSEENTHEKAQAEVASFLAGIQIKKKNLPLPASPFLLKKPVFFLGPLSGMANNDIWGSSLLYLGNLHEKIVLVVEKVSLTAGKQKTVDEMYEAETVGIPLHAKMKATIHDAPGYVFCLEKNPENTYFFAEQQETQQGNSVAMGYCAVKLFYTEKETNTIPWSVTISLETEKQNIDKYFPTLVSLIKSKMSIPTQGENNTQIPFPKKQAAILVVSGQRQGFGNGLAILGQYNLGTALSGTDMKHPLQRKEFLPFFMEIMYGRDTQKQATSIQKIYTDLHIDETAYVNQDLLSSFILLLRMYTAGVQLPTTSPQTLFLFGSLEQEDTFRNERDTIRAYEYGIFGKKKITIEDIGVAYDTYLALEDYTFSPQKGLVEDANLTKEAMHFDASPLFTQAGKNLAAMHACLMRKQDRESNACFQVYANVVDDQLRYPVLTYGEAIDYLLPQIDLGLFDPDLAKKKDTIVE